QETCQFQYTPDTYVEIGGDICATMKRLADHSMLFVYFVIFQNICMFKPFPSVEMAFLWYLGICKKNIFEEEEH
ncbi:hypothetical protein, partial [Pseudomonas sp. 2995-3]|uniref:hypothetical protein n=1 Tax=Pseudomonas sp. 2995-3 TaxID=1712680 RepID=UPI000C6AA554